MTQIRERRPGRSKTATVSAPESAAVRLGQQLWTGNGAAIALLDKGDRIACVNAAFIDLLGYPETDVVGRPCTDLFHPPQPDLGDLSGAVIVKLRHRSGASVSACIQRHDIAPANADGGSGALLITRIRSVAAVQPPETLFDIIRDEIQEQVVLVDTVGRVMYCNEAFARAVGADTPSIINHPVDQLMRHEDHARFRTSMTRARNGERFSEVFTLSKSPGQPSSWLYTTFIPYGPLLDGETVFVILALDITKARDLEERHKITQARYEELLSSVLDAVISTDENGVIVSFNPAAEKLFGYTEKELLGLSLNMLLPPRTRAGHKALMRGYAASGDGGRGMANFREVQGVTKSGKNVYLEIAISQMLNANETRLTAIVRDVTQRRQLETQINHLDKMRAIGQLVAGIAHDFNNVMAVIAGSAEMGVEDFQKKEPARRLFDRILVSARLGKDITAKLLSFSRDENQVPQRVDLRHLFRELSEMMVQVVPINIIVETYVEKGCWCLLADVSQLQNALLNLVINARDAMPRGGRLSVSARNSPSYVLVDQRGSKRALDMVELAVADNGCGMTPEVKQRALEPFFTTKSAGQGNGLGLATVFGVVQRSGGSMDIDSELAKGTTIRLYFPRADRTNPLARSRVVQDGPVTGKRLLIVEDNTPLRITVAEQLRKRGLTVFEAETTAQAREQFSAHGDVDILLTDYRLGEATTGSELAVELRAAKANLCVIIMTGYLELSGARDAPAGTVFLTKPVAIQDLMSNIQRLLTSAVGPTVAAG